MTITAEQLVQREVLACVSSLVATLGQANYCEDDSQELADLKDQALELAAPIDDWEEAARQEGWRPAELAEGMGLRNDNLDRDWPDPTDWRGAAEDAGVEDPYQWEVFEHWIVSDWFADKLIEAGEKVDKDFAGLCIWARTTTGQAIYADAVIERIAAKLNAEFSGSPDPSDPDNYWIDDETGERVNAHTGERSKA